ncbi:MAG: glycosyltransferase family 1 protein [Rhodospirillales bacterium]|nr:glycosyltransferase family 1 protein [Rhodospirillales bacterium]
MARLGSLLVHPDFMTGPTQENARTLLYSQRFEKDLVTQASFYEFEDVVADIDDVTIVENKNETLGSSELDDIFDKISIRRLITHHIGRTEIGRILQQAARRSGLSVIGKKRNISLNSSISGRKFDFFFLILSEPWEVEEICSRYDWHSLSRLSACYIVESWKQDTSALEYLKKYFSRFDALFSAQVHMCERIERICRRPCTYLAPGIDATRFCPVPRQPERTIDLMSIGRRSRVTHDALLAHARNTNFFYLYDTGRQLRFSRHDEHRLLLAEQLKRTRYFLAYPARIDRPELHQGHLEMAFRYIEGAAAGTVMLGMLPSTAEGRKLLDWEDAVIDLPFDAAHIVEVVDHLDSQPQRLSRIRRSGVVNALRRFDWLHSWQKILAAVGLSPTPRLLERQEALNHLADMVEKEPA